MDPRRVERQLRNVSAVLAALHGPPGELHALFMAAPVSLNTLAYVPEELADNEDWAVGNSIFCPLSR